MAASYPSFQRLISCLEKIRSQLDNKQDDFMFLNSYFNSQEFQTLFKVHSAVTNTESRKVDPVIRGASDLLQDVCAELDECCDIDENKDMNELKDVLDSPHVKAMLLAHDRVAADDNPSKDSEDSSTYIHSTPVMRDVYGTGEPVKFITLIKSGNDPLGATVLREPDTGNIIVARILHGGVVDRSGTLHVGDIIQEINGTSVNGRTTDEVVDIMERTSGSVMFKVIPAVQDKKQQNGSKIRLRALFDYDPMKDDLIPCKEAGLVFKKGDVLQVVSKDDPNWWQAKEEGSSGGAIGLIPSKQFQEKRVLFDRMMSSEKDNRNQKNGIRSIMQFKRRRRRKRKSNMDPDSNLAVGPGNTSQLNSSIVPFTVPNAILKDLEAENILTYEEVVHYKPNNKKQRLILLIGPKGVGRNELKKRLLASDNEKFAAAVPHTSRKMRPYETDGREYCFVSRTTMENYEQNNKFIEIGEYKKCLYGLSIDSIKRVLKTGKICILKIQPQAIKILRQKEYKPYIIYIKPPPLEKLRSTRVTTKKGDKKENPRAFKEDDLQEMIKSGEAMEKEYSHHFDETIVNDDLQVAYFELNNAIERVTREALWVPAEWQ